MDFLRRGDRSETVAQLQRLLNQKRASTPPLQADGDFGPRTERAVCNFQGKARLTADGIVGPETWRALGVRQSPSRPAARPAPRWLQIAQQEETRCVREVAGSQHNPRIVEYHQTTSSRASTDETPWCSAFVNWCMGQAGLVGTNRANARSWLNWGQALAAPRYGCVTVLWRGSPSGWQGHVGFYVRETSSHVYLLGGNQGNAVNVRSYPKTRLLGYRWP